MQGPFGRFGVGSGHTGKILIADNHYARDGFRLTVVERSQGRPKRRRTEHLAAEHAGAADIGGIAMTPGDEVETIDFRSGLSRDLPRGWGSYAGIGSDGLHQFAPMGQFAESSRLAGRTDYLAVADGERGAIHLPPLGGETNQYLARRRRGSVQLRRHGGRGEAAERAHVVRGEIGIAHDEANRGKRRAKLLGHSLGERSPGVLADFDFAGVDGDRAILRDVKPGIDRLRPVATVQTAPGAGFLGGSSQNHQEAAAQRSEKSSAVELEVVGGGSI